MSWLLRTGQRREPDKSSLERCNDECGGVSNHRRLDCLLNRLFKRRSQKYQSSASLIFVKGVYRWPVGPPPTGPATRKMFPLNDVIKKGKLLDEHCSCSSRSLKVNVDQINHYRRLLLWNNTDTTMFYWRWGITFYHNRGFSDFIEPRLLDLVFLSNIYQYIS